MKIIIAPDKFKECLSAAAAAAAMAEGVLEVRPDAVIDICPVADGGEGTIDAVLAAAGGQLLTADVFGPLGSPLRARFALIGTDTDAALPGRLGLTAALARAHGQSEAPAGGSVAVIEMSAASGLALVPPDRRDPMRTSTFGTGQLIAAALDAGARRIIVGLGGSATVDGGCGAAQALGVTFILRGGRKAVYPLAGGDLLEIEDFDLSTRNPRLAETVLCAACDVTCPLLGPRGASAVFAPQKGATAEMVAGLEHGLAHLAGLIARKLGVDIADRPGAGAAGGLGAGLAAFAGASLQDGLAIIADAIGLPRRLAGADLCLTGEGCLDNQSLEGKATIGVARLAMQADVPAVCIPGQTDPESPAREHFAAVYPLAAEGITPTAAKTNARDLLRQRAAQAVKATLQN
ncbi:MAG: glycerate kinase [Planctomycetaceae bacterium]|nr:glycerate kinase [Planctomycetaceae bacterium]